MAIINSYQIGTPKTNDLLVGTSMPGVNTDDDPRTVNFSVDDLASYIVGNYPGSPINGLGTFNTIPLWTPDGKTLGDSIITQGASGQVVTVTGQLDVTADFKVSGSTVLNGSLTANGVSQFNAEVKDETGQPGSLGQVLSSTGTNVQWIDTVSGSGTSPFLPYWLDGETLGDSPISWYPTNTPQPKLAIETNVSIDGEVSFLEDITVGAALKAPISGVPNSHTAGTSGQVLTSTGTKVEWVDQSAAITKLVPYFQLATPGGSATYTQSNNIVDFDWSGGSGTYEYILPSATAIPYRTIRFVNNSTITASDKIHITAPGTETIDGGAFYSINKPYNGCAVWSDGVQWIVIQAKA